ncbi:hypothetical protein HOT12_gp10 [Burkholderia phage vB_BmuP_KL4]|uniref:Uncharacterized protein n=1 Tax=Burkholderia phage vB_BmuP_KL4 TaxID=2115967 RepID=A0A2S1GN92_9CAUD|nr:hypothetical protein HOT12_gp10 [Burkholderia phage vB_BmuP_KL4]AWD90851.1 hypothetical protein [Burkholderia phage vB_BmuP_KL4]
MADETTKPSRNRFRKIEVRMARLNEALASAGA